MQYKIVVDKQPMTNPSSEKKEYIIDIEELRAKGNIHDSLMFEIDKTYVIRRLKLSEYYVLSILEEPITEALESVNIELFEGDNYIYLIDMTGNKFYAEYLIKNEFNDVFATRKEMNTAIDLTMNQITMAVNEKFTDYSTTEEMNSAITTIEEIGIRKDAAIANQEKLNEYFELALAGNINITRDSITSLLEQFDLTEEETREAAKILMFPEDALYDYDAKIKESEKKSISEVMQEAKSQEEVVAPKEEVVEPVEIKEEPVKIQEEVKSEPVASRFDREDLIDLFNEIGLDYLDYTTSDLDEILDHFNEKVIRRNVNIFKENDLSLDIFVDHINLLYDKELEAKMDRLQRIGKSALDIYLNPTVLTKYDYKGLDKAILLLQNSGLDPKKVPLMAY